MKICSAIINLFHLIPAAPQTLVKPLLEVVMKTERAMLIEVGQQLHSLDRLSDCPILQHMCYRKQIFKKKKTHYVLFFFLVIHCSLFFLALQRPVV